MQLQTIKFKKMKTTHITTLLATAIICVSILSCTKQTYEPIPSCLNPNGCPETYAVASDWFSIDALGDQGSTVKQFSQNVPGLTIDLLKTGKVLVFGEVGSEMAQPAALPINFDRCYVSVTAVTGELRFVIAGNGVISNTIRLRYILIPANSLAPDGFDYLNYQAVCTYYKIAE